MFKLREAGRKVGGGNRGIAALRDFSAIENVPGKVSRGGVSVGKGRDDSSSSSKPSVPPRDGGRGAGRDSPRSDPLGCSSVDGKTPEGRVRAGMGVEP